MKNTVIAIVLIISLFGEIFCQTNSDFSDPYSNWDGVTHWSKYMRYSPRYFGPNALPVPKNMNGRISENLEFRLAAEYHHHSQDPTYNAFTSLEIPIVKNRVNLEIHVVPIEFYNMDTSLRIERRTFNKEGKSTAGGDIYVNQHIQIIQNHKKIPDMALRFGLRTASGLQLRHARFTDAPGYYFDLSLGKDFLLSKTDSSRIRLYASGGFYCWHTNENDRRQNDAFMYGVGIDLLVKKTKVSLQASGYSGYIDNGDKPLVVRAKIEPTNKHKFRPYLQIQQGLNDFPYTSFQIGLIFSPLR
ncbi:MAG: hypothetical protein RBS19_05540 [Bacteroidales bacterium]|nr:hypothetical protein [Bacteroidales bacterium]MDY0216400.1 hypothetical protein [Bacteroidales bacterium]